MFETRFEIIENKMIEIIQQNILPNSQDKNISNTLSYANIVRPVNTDSVNTDFRNIVIAAKNEERIEERDKKLREVCMGKWIMENQDQSK